jgi:hypothetical protein
MVRRYSGNSTLTYITTRNFLTRSMTAPAQVNQCRGVSKWVVSVIFSESEVLPSRDIEEVVMG